MLIQLPKAAERPSPGVPHAIHQVWLGGRDIPPTLAGFMRGVRDAHPEWGYHVWTEAALPRLWAEDEFGLEAVYDGWDNPGFRSDIVRLLVLHQFGGVYLDTDCELRRTLGPLADACDAFIGATFSPQPFADVTVENAVLGAAPGHPFLKLACERLPANVREALDPGNPVDSILAATGPIYLSRLLAEYRASPAALRSDVAVVPARLLYPAAPHAPWPDFTDSYVRHHWRGSWFRKELEQ